MTDHSLDICGYLAAHPLTICRFVSSPIADMEKRLSKETIDLKLEVQNLGKKLHYLETTHKNSREHIDQIFNGRGRG